MSLFLLGILISGLLFGTIAYNCYTKREAVERGLRTNIANLEHNISVVKKEMKIVKNQLEDEVKKVKEQNKKAFMDIDMLTKDNDSLRRQLAECEKKLKESLD